MEPTTLALIATVVGLILYWVGFRKMNHFAALGIPHVKPVPFFGNMLQPALRRVAMVDHIQDYCRRFPGAKYFGFYEFSRTTIVVRDPELMASIGVKNFDYFVDRTSMVDASVDHFTAANLFFLRGDQWREVRKTLSPTFTTSKMKHMFKLIDECADKFVRCVLDECSKPTGGGGGGGGSDGKEMDVKEILSRYTNDVLGTCAFGITIDSMKEPDNEFFVFGKKATRIEGMLSLKLLFGSFFKPLSRLFGWKIISDETARFFYRLMGETVTARENRGIVRPDMIQQMMASRVKGTTTTTTTNGAPELTIEDMAAQAFAFYFGGFDSTSTVLSFMMHEIAINEGVQERLRSEIDEVLRESKGEPTYEDVTRMKYLKAVIKEALRLHPLSIVLDRQCLKEFQLPAPTADGKPVLVRPGQAIWFPPYAIHRDPQYYPDPERFMPERFLRGEVNQSVYMPFGIGPRMCIGNRLAMLFMKMLLFHLVAKCAFETCSRTASRITFSKKIFLTMPEKDLWLKFRARDNTNCETTS